ncbi:hypothetical protein [Sphingobium aromaticiconvertens]|uniref:hypothetical protein n=1 Tax=Sphingobium aromaticiconvertens TaxID=365341 RepID=UPI003018DABD
MRGVAIDTEADAGNRIVLDRENDVIMILLQMCVVKFEAAWIVDLGERQGGIDRSLAIPAPRQ